MSIAKPKELQQFLKLIETHDFKIETPFDENGMWWIDFSIASEWYTMSYITANGFGFFNQNDDGDIFRTTPDICFLKVNDAVQYFNHTFSAKSAQVFITKNTTYSAMHPSLS